MLRLLLKFFSIVNNRVWKELLGKSKIGADFTNLKINVFNN